MAPVVVVLGPTGAGKSDQARRLAQTKGWIRISSGDLLRASRQPELVESVKLGALAPTEKIWELVSDKLKPVSPSEGLVLDGFPRMLSEAELLDNLLSQLGRKISRVIEVYVSPAVAQQRIAHRGRPDDSPAAVANKRQWYDTETAKVLERYHDVIKRVDGTPSPDEVAKSLEAAL